MGQRGIGAFKNSVLNGLILQVVYSQAAFFKQALSSYKLLAYGFIKTLKSNLQLAVPVHNIDALFNCRSDDDKNRCQLGCDHFSRQSKTG